MTSDSKSKNVSLEIKTSWIKNDNDPQKQYDRAISLVEYYVQVTWLVFGAFLLTETILLAAIVSISDKCGTHEKWVLGGALLGLILSYPWWASFRYNHALYLLHLTEAENCEPENGCFFTNGKALINGKSFSGPRKEKIKIPWAARLVSPSMSVNLLIIIFAMVFILIAYTKIPQLTFINIFCNL